MQAVEFLVEGVTVAADLYLPPDMAPGERRPAIVCGHGFSFVKEGLVAQGEQFSAAGYVVLAIDYRSFGLSEGNVRGELFPLRMVEDFRGAITYLEGRHEVAADRIAIWGTSFAGGVVLAAAAADRRIKATIAQVPIVDAGQWMRWLRTPEQWERLVDALEQDRRSRFQGQAGARIPAARHFSSAEICGMPGDDASINSIQSMGAYAASWIPDITLESIEKIIEFHPNLTIEKIAPRPLCMIIATGYETLHPVEPALAAYAQAREPKSLALVAYDQLGLYREPGVSAGIGIALSFLLKHLPVHAAA